MQGHLPKPLRIVRNHARLLASFAIGLLMFGILPSSLRLSTRVLIGWDIAVAIYLALAFGMISRFDLQRVRMRAANLDEGGGLMLLLTVAAAVASLAAIFVELGSIRDVGREGSGLYVAVAILTVLLSWTFIHVIFALHYAHEFYAERSGKRSSGLEFPDDDRPDYWDFVYFSFVIGMTFQVSDVQVTSKKIRHIVVSHGAVSFFYNVAVLALMVNIGGEYIK